MAKPDAIKPLARSKHIFWLNYGYPGCGKTRLLGTVEKPSLIVRPPTDHVDSIINPGAHLEEWVVHDWAEMDEVEEFLRHEGEQYDWVFLDSISLFQDTGLDDIWDATITRRPDRKQYGADKGEYGINMQRLSRWVRSAVTPDKYNFGITAHPFEGLDIETGNTILKPYVQGKGMSDKIQGYMNIVTFMEKKKQKDGSFVRVLRTADSEDYDSKDQFDCLDNGRLVNPTVPKLVAKIDAKRPKARATSRSTGTAKKRPAKRRRKTS